MRGISTSSACLLYIDVGRVSTEGVTWACQKEPLCLKRSPNRGQVSQDARQCMQSDPAHDDAEVVFSD